MYENKFFIKDGVIYDTIYGFIKQYICANAIWLLLVLTFTYRVKIDKCVSCPFHGGIKIDGINGSDYSCLWQNISW